MSTNYSKIGSKARNALIAQKLEIIEAENFAISQGGFHPSTLGIVLVQNFKELLIKTGVIRDVY